MLSRTIKAQSIQTNSETSWNSKAKRLCFIFLTQRMGHQSACTSKLLNFCYASKTNLRLSETGQAPQAWRAESHEMALRPLRDQLSETGLAPPNHT